jgi:hypothetical protein
MYVMETHLNILALPIPEKFSITENHQEITIEKKWFSARHITLFIFSLIWNSILLFFFTAMVMGHAPLFVYLFTMFHAIAGSWMLYTAICGFVNKTILQANNQFITVRHSPFPWTRQRKVDRRDIDQVYVTQEIHSNKGITYITYSVHLLTRNNKTLSLLKGLDTLAEARFIEQKLEVF